MSKKSETLEIRVSQELKCKLSDLSAERGSSMSEVVRGVIDRELSGQRQETVEDQDMPLRPLRAHSSKALYILPVLVFAGLYWGAGQEPVSATPYARVFFAELDQNGDGLVTESEFYEFLTAEEALIFDDECDPALEPCTPEQIAAEEVRRADVNRDGRVEFTEFESSFIADRAIEFSASDLDQNGRLSEDEYLSTYVQFMAEDLHGGPPLSGDCLTLLQNEQVDGVAGACLSDSERRMLMAEFDVNFDGQITLEEFLQN